MRVHVLVTDDVFDLGLAAVLDTLSLANDIESDCGPVADPIQVHLVARRQSVRSARGMILPTAPLASLVTPDAVIVPAIGYKRPEAIEGALRRPDLMDVKATLREFKSGGALIGAACTGTWLLADSGLLDGHRATTSWWLADSFRVRFPDVALDESRVLVTSAPFVTAGAALAHVDLALELIRRRSPTLAGLASRYLLIEPRTSQAPYMVPDLPGQRDAITERFERWARSQLANGFSLQQAATSIGTSPRTLARRLQQSIGKSPLSYFQDLRVQHAVHLLETTDQNIEQVAASVGYSEGVTLRTLLKRKLGKGVRELRRGSRLRAVANKKPSQL